jgi:hypothetical protein
VLIAGELPPDHSATGSVSGYGSAYPYIRIGSQRQEDVAGAAGVACDTPADVTVREGSQVRQHLDGRVAVLGHCCPDRNPVTYVTAGLCSVIVCEVGQHIRWRVAVFGHRIPELLHLGCGKFTQLFL